MNNLRDDFTSRLLADSGVGSGMRVLDVGCGTGDVSLLAAGLVGRGGEVVGFDISETALAAARKTAQETQAANITFIQSDIAALPEGIGVFDAVIGRRVLMYLDDVPAGIRRLLCHLSAGGKMVFQESDSMAAALCADSLPLHTQVQRWVWETVAKEGGDVHIGSQLYARFKHAGLKVTQLRAEAVLHTCESGSDLGWVAGMLAPRMLAHNVVTAAELNIDTLEERLRLELCESDTPFIRDMAFGICAEKTI